MARYLFVDHENINASSIGSLSDPEVEVWVFVGPQQKSLPMETVKSLLARGSKTRIVEIAKPGKNSLDFHISFELGALSRAEPKPEKVYVLSNDKGYDSVVAYAKDKDLSVQRITNVAQVEQPKGGRAPGRRTAPQRPGPGAVRDRPHETQTKAVSGDLRGRIVDALQKMDGKQRPRKQDKLRAYMINRFKKEPAEAVNRAIGQLLSSGRVVGEKGNVKYNL